MMGRGLRTPGESGGIMGKNCSKSTSMVVADTGAEMRPTSAYVVLPRCTDGEIHALAAARRVRIVMGRCGARILI